MLGLALAGVPGALGAGLGAVEGAGLGMGAGLGAALTVGFSELTLPVLAGLTEPSPLAVRGVGLTAVTVRSCVVCVFDWANRATVVLTTVVIEVAAEAINGLGSLTLERTGGPTHCNDSGCGSSVLRFLQTSSETGWPEFSVNDGVGAFLLGEPDLSTPRSSGCVWKEVLI